MRYEAFKPAMLEIINHAPAVIIEQAFMLTLIVVDGVREWPRASHDCAAPEGREIRKNGDKAASHLAPMAIVRRILFDGDGRHGN